MLGWPVAVECADVRLLELVTRALRSPSASRRCRRRSRPPAPRRRRDDLPRRQQLRRRARPVRRSGRALVARRPADHRSAASTTGPALPARGCAPSQRSRGAAPGRQRRRQVHGVLGGRPSRLRADERRAGAGARRGRDGAAAPARRLPQDAAAGAVAAARGHDPDGGRVPRAARAPAAPSRRGTGAHRGARVRVAPDGRQRAPADADRPRRRRGPPLRAQPQPARARGDGLDAVSALARKVPAFTLVSTDLPKTARLIASLCDAPAQAGAARDL